ncbi:MAG: trypsin-like serine protease [Baekduiaceae bacterium]
MRRTKLVTTVLLLALAWTLQPVPAPAGAVVGGRAATPADNPAMAGLVRSGQAAVDSLFCGGSVISPTAVVTAAHCLEGGLKASQIDVVAGGVRLTDPTLQRARVSRVLVHPGYDDVRTVHDVAVLLLATPLTVPPVALATPAEASLGAPGAILRLTGWGEQRYNSPESLPDTLRYADIPVVANSACKRLFDVYDGALQLCGRAANNRPDSCQGDSGGPLIGGTAPAVRLVGIVSYSADQCGSPGFAGVYVRVSAERDWIAAAAGLDGPAALLPAQPAAPAVRKTVRTRIGTISCDEDSCSVVVRVSGSGRRDVSSVVVRVRRPEQRGFSATSRYVQARKVAPGVYRARTLLPFGIVNLTAVAFDAAGTQLGVAAREQIEVFDA